MRVWNSGLKIVKPKILIPYKLLLVCNSIQKKLENYEFSILAKGRWTSDGFKLSSDYVIPEQEVSHCSVEYDNKDVLKYLKQGYNVVIHSHPFDSSDFSGIDDEYINANFQCSILYSNSKFTNAVLNIKINNEFKLQIKPEIKLIHDKIDVDISKIKKKEIVSVKVHTHYPSSFLYY